MRRWKADFLRLVRLAVPVVLIQIGMMLMGVVDTIMIGHIAGAAEAQRAALAAVALGHFYTWLCIVFPFGCLMALDPIVAQAAGAGDQAAIARGLQRGLLLALGFLLPALLIAFEARTFLAATRQPAAIIPDATLYVHVNGAGFLAFFVFTVFRQTLQALGHLPAIGLCVLVSNLLNVGLNWVLIYGNLGFAPMGVEGSAWATVISRWAMAGLLLAVAWRQLAPHLVPWRPETLRLRPLARMLRLGAPIGAQYLLEFGIFGVAALMMGWIGVVETGGHQIALNLASLSFNVPLGVSAAAAVLVGRAVGRRDPGEARRAAVLSLVAGMGIMLAFCLLFLLAPEPLARIYTGEGAVLAVAATLLPIAGVFQVFDGLQVVSIGILRGIGDTTPPMVINVLGFWLIGLPTSLLLAFSAGHGPKGIWWGLVVGLAVVAALLVLRVWAKLGRELVPIDVDRMPALSPAGLPPQAPGESRGPEGDRVRSQAASNGNRSNGIQEGSFEK